MLSISIHKSIPNPNTPEVYHNNFQVAQCNFETLAKLVTTYVWSPIIWNTGKRDRRYFRACDLLVLDFDEGLRIEEAKRRFCDCQHIIAPTKSHTEEEHRFRLIIPLERPIIAREEYEVFMKLMVRKYDADYLCKDAARFYFPSKSVYSLNENPDDYAAEIPNLRAAIQKEEARERAEMNRILKKKKRSIPGYINKLFTDGCPKGQRNITVFKVAIELTYRGFHEIEIFRLFKDSPMDLEEQEMKRTIRNGVKKALSMLHQAPKVETTGTNEVAHD